MRRSGFTLAELVIALAILGVIATFTIPKVLQSQQSGRDVAIAKEFAAMFSGAFEAYKSENTVTSATTVAHLTPYMNYVRLDTTAYEVDNDPGVGGTVACNVVASIRCLHMHSGAVGLLDSAVPFGSTDTTSAILFLFDPDGGVTGGAGDTGTAVIFVLQYNGRLGTLGKADASIYWAGASVTALGGTDPSWFSWN